MNEFLEVAKLIAKFQLLEASLKVLLDTHENSTIAHINKPHIENYSDNDDLSYGILLKRYKKYFNKSDTYDLLFSLKEYRNFFAHKGLLYSAPFIPQNTKNFLKIVPPNILDFKMIENTLDNCFDKIRLQAINQHHLVIGL